MHLIDIVELNAARTPEAPALEAAGRVISFHELCGRVRRLGNALGGLARTGDRIAILAENIPEYVDAYYAVPGAGMILTLLNYRLHPTEWVGIVNDAGARVLLVQESYFDEVEAVLADMPSIQHVVVIGAARGEHTAYDELLTTASTASIGHAISADDTAWLLYTSGTTGRPKGAMLTDRAVTQSVLQSVVEYEHPRGDRMLLTFPMCHIAGFNVLLAHCRGGLVVLPPRFEPESWLRLIEAHRIGSTGLAPSMMAQVLQHPACGRYDTSSLHGVVYGTASMPVELLRTFIDRFGPIVYTGFGMTETSGGITTLDRREHAEALAGDPAILGSCGRPMCLADARVIDDDGHDMPNGAVGEIAVRGEQLMKGYWRRDEATRAAFVDDTWFRTGDLARRDDDGRLYIVDRKKDMIISGGENVYSREVEEVLFKHPDVLEAAVVGVDDALWGERVTAVVVGRPGTAPSPESLLQLCRNHLGGFKVPKQIEFIDELPRNASGKVLKTKLRDQLTRTS